MGRDAPGNRAGLKAGGVPTRAMAAPGPPPRDEQNQLAKALRSRRRGALQAATAQLAASQLSPESLVRPFRPVARRGEVGADRPLLLLAAAQMPEVALDMLDRGADPHAAGLSRLLHACTRHAPEDTDFAAAMVLFRRLARLSSGAELDLPTDGVGYGIAPYHRSLLASLICIEAPGFLFELLDHPGLSGELIAVRGGRGLGSGALSVEAAAEQWNDSPAVRRALADWRRWRGLRAAWVSVVLRAAFRRQARMPAARAPPTR